MSRLSLYPGSRQCRGHVSGGDCHLQREKTSQGCHASVHGPEGKLQVRL